MISPPPFRVIEQSRLKPILALPVFAMFAFAGVWMVGDADGSSRYSPLHVTLVGMAAIGFAAWGLFRLVKILLKPMRLLLNRDGFLVENGDGRGLIAWSDITPFELFRSKGTSLVGYRIVSDGPMVPILSDRYLPANLAISARELFEIMETQRKIHGRVKRPNPSMTDGAN